MPFWCGIRCKTVLEDYGCGCGWAIPEKKPKDNPGVFGEYVLVKKQFFPKAPGRGSGGKFWENGHPSNIFLPLFLVIIVGPLP